MIILGIDPGPTTSGVVWYDPNSGRVKGAEGAAPNDEIFRWIGDLEIDSAVAIEQIQALYAHVGKETVKTIHFTGRLYQHAITWGGAGYGFPVTLLSPQEVKKAVCGTAAAKDPAVRQALIDRLGKPGTKKQPGATYGVTKHAWRALAVAVAADMGANA